MLMKIARFYFFPPLLLGMDGPLIRLLMVDYDDLIRMFLIKSLLRLRNSAVEYPEYTPCQSID